MKVIVTAGATEEKIDSVRVITNISTGKLGCTIAKKYARLREVDQVYYICNKSAVQPKNEKIKIIYIDNTQSLQKVIENILAKETIGVIIQGMAVSDYKVKTVIDLETLAMNLWKREKAADFDTPEAFAAFLKKEIMRTTSLVQGSQKMSSTGQQPLILLDQTPKIIASLREFAPNAIIIGFKLLNDVPFEQLYSVAFSMLEKNQCDFVVANDLQEVGQDRHIAYLMNQSGQFQKLHSKEEIAEELVKKTVVKE